MVLSLSEIFYNNSVSKIHYNHCLEVKQEINEFVVIVHSIVVGPMQYAMIWKNLFLNRFFAATMRIP